MGVAKAALESVSRYLARDLGPRGIRVNLVSAGPIETIAAGAIPGFDTLAELWRAGAPLGWDTRDAAPVAATVCFLLSDYARAITGEIVHVDGGFHAMDAVLDDETVFRLDPHLASREKEQIRSGLASRDLGRGENMRIEVMQQPYQRETPPHSLRPAA